jgi:hypothetical protein
VIKSELSLEVSNSTNTKVMRLFDTSHYCSDETVENYIIEVLPVNKSKWVSFNVAKNFSLALNSSNLRYKIASDAVQLIPLPDGVYEIKQSIKPNLFTVSHYYHLRVTDIENRLRNEMKKLRANECKLDRSEYMKNRDVLRDIDEYIISAKWSVEECADKAQGIELYTYANKLIQRYCNECKC